jgi:hypothetical protein
LQQTTLKYLKEAGSFHSVILTRQPSVYTGRVNPVLFNDVALVFPFFAHPEGQDYGNCYYQDND